VALTPPDTDQFLEFMMRDSWAEVEYIPGTATQKEERAEYMLQQATDLFYMATGLTEDPEDETHLRIVEQGIMSMAHALVVRAEDRDAEYAPFSSETIGSYSYSKAAGDVQARQSTGIAGFDAAVLFFNGINPDAMGAESWARSEHVFSQPFTQAQADLAHAAYAASSSLIIEPDVAGR
jgi:hypothetical protein